MELLDKYLDLQKQLFDYFGYVEDWCVFPVDDARDYYWHLTGEGCGDRVEFAKHEFTRESWLSHELYTQRFLPKWVYRGAEYTMILVNTHTDGNKLLQIFDNAKERRE